jgi:hypothetical protein
MSFSSVVCHFRRLYRLLPFHSRGMVLDKTSMPGTVGKLQRPVEALSKTSAVGYSRVCLMSPTPDLSRSNFTFNRPLIMTSFRLTLRAVHPLAATVGSFTHVSTKSHSLLT